MKRYVAALAVIFVCTMLQSAEVELTERKRQAAASERGAVVQASVDRQRRRKLLKEAFTKKFYQNPQLTRKYYKCKNCIRRSSGWNFDKYDAFWEIVRILEKYPRVLSFSGTDHERSLLYFAATIAHVTGEYRAFEIIALQDKNSARRAAVLRCGALYMDITIVRELCRWPHSWLNIKADDYIRLIPTEYIGVPRWLDKIVCSQFSNHFATKRAKIIQILQTAEKAGKGDRAAMRELILDSDSSSDDESNSSGSE